MMLMAIVVLRAFFCLTPHLEETPPESQPPSADQIVAAVLRTEDAQRAHLGKYSVIRKYTVRNPHITGEAVLRVLWSFEPGRGKQFKVISNQGASGLARLSLMKLLETEASDSHLKTNPSRISPDHYDFKLIVEGKDDYKLSLKPREKTKYVLNGTAIVSKRDSAIVRVEGRTSKRISFWVSEADIIQEFANYRGFWMPRKTLSRVQIRLAGRTELTIESEDYQFSDSAQPANK